MMMLGMTRYGGGDEVPAGDYWNLIDGERCTLREAGTLPGYATEIYYRMPAAYMLLLAPALGLAYAIFLPFVGLAMAAVVSVRLLLRRPTRETPAKEESSH